MRLRRSYGVARSWTCELLTLNPDRGYQPTGKPSGRPKKNTATLTRVRGVLDILRHHTPPLLVSN